MFYKDETLAEGRLFDEEDPSSWDRKEAWEHRFGEQESGLKRKLEPKLNFIQILSEEIDGEVFSGGKGENAWEYVKVPYLRMGMCLNNKISKLK